MNSQQTSSVTDNTVPSSSSTSNNEHTKQNSSATAELHDGSMKLDMWNIDNMSPDFTFLNVPDDTFTFLQSNNTESNGETPQTLSHDSPSTGTLFSHNKPSPSVNGRPTINAKTSPSFSLSSTLKAASQSGLKDSVQGNYLLNHYENILKQNKVSMKEALSPVSQFSPSNSAQINSPSPGASVSSIDTRKQQRANYSNHPSPLQHTQSSAQPQSQSPDKPAVTCDHCRRRQIKCVMVPNISNCIQCETKGIKCTYSESPSNPVLKRNMGVLTSMESPKRQKMGNLAQQQQQHHQHQQQQQHHQQQQQQHTNGGTPNTSNPPILFYPRSSFFVGSSSIFDTLLLDKIKLDRIDQVQLNKSLSLRQVSPSVQFILRDDNTDELAIRALKEVDFVESLVQPYGPNLVQLYFRIVHPYFPILHRNVFIEKYSRSYREFSASLLATVYSLACKWWDHDPKLSNFPKPDVQELNNIALKTFTEDTERPRLSAVQAGLLLLDCRSENQNNWILVQQVVSLTEELGLGLDCQDWKLPKWERGLRRRLAWAVWVQEKWSALSESRVSRFKFDRNWMVQELIDDDFPEADNNPMMVNELETQIIENGRSLFKEFVQLSLILNEILEEFYTYSALKNLNRIDEVLKAAKPLQFKLRQWYHSLPIFVQMNNHNDKLNSNGFLHLSYLAVEITLHRRIIASLTVSSSSIPPELTKVCRAAATTRLIAIIEFVKNLKTEHLLSFWHSSTTYSLTVVGTFASILYVTSGSFQESQVYKEHINLYRAVLLKLSKNFKPASVALQTIDTLLSQVPGLLGNNGFVKSGQSPYMVQLHMSLNPDQKNNIMPNNQPSQRTGNIGTPPVTTADKK